MNSRFKLFRIAALIGALAVSVSASANTVNFGNVTGLTGKFTTAFGDSFNTPIGMFTDFFNFTISKTSKFTGSLSTVSSDTDLVINLLDVTLTGSVASPGLVKKILSSDADNKAYSYKENLSPGVYSLRVTGDVTGGSGGSYGGNFNVSAVPEPKNYGMLLLGAGLLVVAARRKSGSI